MAEQTPSGVSGGPPLDGWYYQRPSPGGPQYGGPVTFAELEALMENGAIQPNTLIGRHGQEAVPAHRLISVGPPVHPSAKDFLAERANSLATVLSGPNNSGKSLALKRLKRALGADACMLACSRFYQVDALQGAPGNKDQEKYQWHENFLSNTAGAVNNENNQVDLANMLLRLKNSEREKLFELCGEVLGGKFSLRSIDPDNVFSPRYIDLNGSRLRIASTGTRLILTVFAACLDSYFDALLIDEPEIGISPKAQATVAKYLFDPELRQKWFPHLRSIYIATHSHLFLDRTNISNNFSVRSSSGAIEIRQIQTIADFHELQFNMLGNDLESMFLPSAIALVEGPSDYAVLDRAFKLRYPSKRITVINADTEGEMPNKMKIMADIFEGIKTSPYRQRIFFALDSVISKGRRGTREKLESQGALPANIMRWSRNGIEYYYPKDIMREVFTCGNDALDRMTIDGDNVTINGITYTKVQLGDEVARRLSSSSEFGGEVEVFLKRVGCAGDPAPDVSHADPQETEVP